MEGALETRDRAPSIMGQRAEDACARIRHLFEETLRDEAIEWEEAGGVPRSVFERLGEIGAFEARWPDGSRGTGRVDVAATIVREMAVSSLGACIALGTHMETYMRALGRSEHGTAVWPDALAGRAVGALAVSERSGGSTPTNCETRARRGGEGWVISGHKHYVSNMRAANDVMVFARTGEGRELTAFTMFAVPVDAPGVRVTPHRLVGAAASATSMVDFDEVEIPDGRRAGRVGSGLPLLLELLRAERVGAACGAFAVAELCFEVAFAYASVRSIGGTSLRHHQAISHRLAELACELAAGRALLDERLRAAQRGRISSAEAGQAKLVLNRIACRAADEAVQILGGRGYTEETPLARIWRDIRVGRIGGGADEVQLELVAQALRPGSWASHPAVEAARRSNSSAEVES